VERILDTAARLVVDDGVDRLSTRGIAESAQVPVASLYQYFADKDDILLALVERDIAEMDRQVAADLGALDRLSVSSIVAATMNAFVTVYRDRPAFVEIWLRGRTNQAIREYGRAHNAQVAHDLHALARGLGLVTDEGTEQIARIAVEMGDRLFQLAFEREITGDEVVLREAVKVVTTYLDLYATPAGRDGVPASDG
jgi:AcrR family transcriptional regulator